MPTDALKNLSIANAPKPKNSIEQVRSLVDSGMTSSEARKTARKSPVITPESLATQPTPTLVPPATPTEAPAMQADLAIQSEDAFTQAQTAAKNATEAPKTNALAEYLASIRASQGEVARTAQEYAKEGGVDAITPELNAINDQIRREQRALDLAKRNITERGGGLASGAAAEIGNLERVSLQKQADMSIIQMGVQGRYDSAKEIADRAVSAQLENQKILNDALKFNYEEKKADWTTAEQREFETLLGNRNRALETEKENKTAIYDLAIQAQQDGAPTSVVSQMMKAKTKEEAAGLGGSYIGALEREAQRANIAQSYASQRNSLITSAKSGDPQAISQLGFDPNKTTPLSEYSNIIDTASLLVGAERGQETRRAMASAVERGDYQTTYSMLANNVQSSLQGESASRFGAARTDIQVLGGLRDTIKEFENAGGDTGYLVGTADQIARKFGQLATDPKFAALAVQLEREFQAYRQSMTGAAFSPSESAEYEKVNPSTNKSLELNSATIDGALRQLENRVVGTTEAYVPGSREIYDLATGKEKVVNTSDPSKEPVGSVLEIGGVRYRKVGEDAYEPI